MYKHEFIIDFNVTFENVLKVLLMNSVEVQRMCKVLQEKCKLKINSFHLSFLTVLKLKQ